MKNIIEKAMEFAAVKHEGQFRKGTNIPYIIHPFGVAFILQKGKQSDEVIAAGLLHDTLEDTDTTEDELREYFGEEILKLVKAASEPDKSLSWEERKQHTIAELPNRSNEELAVIIADKLHNLRSIQADVEQNGDHVWSRFKRGKRDQSWYYMAICHEVESRKQEVPFILEFVSEVQKFFIGNAKISEKDIDLLFRCSYDIDSSRYGLLEKRNLIRFVEEVAAQREEIYRNSNFKVVEPLLIYLEEQGIDFQTNSDGPFILLAYLTELKHRMGWSNEQFYKHFLRNRSFL